MIPAANMLAFAAQEIALKMRKVCPILYRSHEVGTNFGYHVDIWCSFRNIDGCCC